MKFDKFKVEKEFFTASGRWECTDKGKRTIIAIKKDHDDPTWYKGPPYLSFYDWRLRGRQRNIELYFVYKHRREQCKLDWQPNTYVW